MYRILIVEDNEDNRRIARDVLRSAGYVVLEATTGRTGLAMAREEHPDLILMDIQLPELDGYEVTRQIRRSPGSEAIPIVVVTSYALSGDDVKAFEAGCDDYLAKPVSPRELLAKVKQHLRASPEKA